MSIGGPSKSHCGGIGHFYIITTLLAIFLKTLIKVVIESFEQVFLLGPEP